MSEKSSISPRECVEFMLKNDACSTGLGMQYKNIDYGTATVEMKVRTDMLNGYKSMHGGMIFSLADTCFAMACNSYNLPNVGEYCTISYLNPAFEGDVLTAVAEEVHQQGRNGIYDIKVTNQDGLKIAEFRGKSRQVKGQIIKEITE